MKDRLLKEKDVIQIAYQLPYIVNTEFIEAVRHVPTAGLVEPIRLTGKWEGDRCSICGEERAWYGTNPNYCPDCGADMRGADDEESV